MKNLIWFLFGTVSILLLGHSVQISSQFRQPVTIASTTSPNPLGMSSRTHIFMDLGLSWILYSTGNSIDCIASPVGENEWSMPLEVTSNPNAEALSLYENSTSHLLYIVQTNSKDTMNVAFTSVSGTGCSSISTGNWDFNQTITTLHTFSSDPAITATSNSNIFVGLTTENSTSNPRIAFTEVWKYNGSWFGQTIASWGGSYVPGEENVSFNYFPNWADPMITFSRSTPSDVTIVAIESSGATQKGGYAYFFYSTNDGNNWTEAPGHSSDKYSDTYGGAFMYGTTIDVIASGNSPINYFNYTIGADRENSTEKQLVSDAVESAASFTENGSVLVLYSGGVDPRDGTSLYYILSSNYGSSWSNSTQISSDNEVTFPQLPLTFGLYPGITAAWENSSNPDAKGVRSSFLNLESSNTTLTSKNAINSSTSNVLQLSTPTNLTSESSAVTGSTTSLSTILSAVSFSSFNSTSRTGNSPSSSSSDIEPIGVVPIIVVTIVSTAVFLTLLRRIRKR